MALVAPVPVQDTDDVKKAKEEHAKAVADAKARNAAAEKSDDADKPQSRRKRGLLTAAPIVAAAPAITYSAVATPVVALAQPAVREATLTKIVNNPLHAVSYRVD